MVSLLKIHVKDNSAEFLRMDLMYSFMQYDHRLYDVTPKHEGSLCGENRGMIYRSYFN